MDVSTALHTAARRYCLYWLQARNRDPEAARLGAERLWSGDPEGDDSEDDGSIPTGVLLDILRAVESVDPGSFGSLDSLRRSLIEAADMAPRADSWDRQDTVNANEERQRYREFVAGLTPAELERVEPLPYRRPLTEREVDELWHALVTTWGVPADLGSDWYPTADHLPPRPDVLTFYTYLFDDGVPLPVLQNVLRHGGVQRVWLIDTGDPQFRYELDVELLGLGCDWECYWFGSNMDWIIYVSHRDRLIVGGAWLVSALQAAWPGWQDALYDEPDRNWPPEARGHR